MLSIPDLLKRIPVLERAFQEQLVIVQEVMRHASEILAVDERVPEQFRVTLDPVPPYLLTFPLNMISSTSRRLARARCVDGTAQGVRAVEPAVSRMGDERDNLLDHEDRVTFPVRMPGSSRVMRQVIVIMLADRIMNRVLAQAQADGVLTAQEVNTLSDESLRVLLPSAAEEASEEGGVVEWPKPNYVLEQLHPLKTGILFQLPLLGPENIERTWIELSSPVSGRPCSTSRSRSRCSTISATWRATSASVAPTT